MTKSGLRRGKRSTRSEDTQSVGRGKRPTTSRAASVVKETRKSKTQKVLREGRGISSQQLVRRQGLDDDVGEDEEEESDDGSENNRASVEEQHDIGVEEDDEERSNDSSSDDDDEGSDVENIDLPSDRAANNGRRVSAVLGEYGILWEMRKQCCTGCRSCPLTIICMLNRR